MLSADKNLVLSNKKGASVSALNSLIEDAKLQYRATKSDAVNGTVIVFGVTVAGKK